MSWSMSTSGLAAVVVVAAAGWKAVIAESDAAWNAPEGVRQGHAAQAEIAEAAVKSITEKFPDREFSISAAGHANEDGSGNVSVYYTLVEPAQAQESSAAETEQPEPVGG